PTRLRWFSSCHDLGGNQNDTCDCCLIKQSAVRKLDPQSAMEACARKGRCTFDRNLKMSTENGTGLITRARSRLKAMTIIPVDKLPNIPSLPLDGVLTEHEVHAILKSLHEQGHLALPFGLFVDQDGLRIKPLNPSAKGVYSGQLFSIQYDPYYLRH